MNPDVTDPKSRAERARVFAALGDPTRLGIMELVSLQDLSPDALAAELGISGNLLAHHLRVLQQVGLIRRAHSQHDRRRWYVQSAMQDWPALAPLVDAGDRLRAPRVVFVCTHNSARSVLAEAMWRQFSTVPCASAGTAPASRVNPRARRAARAIGLPMDSRVPRHIDEVLNADDVVVSVCDAVNEELPAMTNPRLHWSIGDPSAIDTDRAFVQAAGEIRQRVERLVPRITSTAPNSSNREAQ